MTSATKLMMSAWRRVRGRCRRNLGPAGRSGRRPAPRAHLL